MVVFALEKALISRGSGCISKTEMAVADVTREEVVYSGLKSSKQTILNPI